MFLSLYKIAEESLPGVYKCYNGLEKFPFKTECLYLLTSSSLRKQVMLRCFTLSSIHCKSHHCLPFGLCPCAWNLLILLLNSVSHKKTMYGDMGKAGKGTRDVLDPCAKCNKNPPPWHWCFTQILPTETCSSHSPLPLYYLHNGKGGGDVDHVCVTCWVWIPDLRLLLSLLGDYLGPKTSLVYRWEGEASWLGSVKKSQTTPPARLTYQRPTLSAHHQTCSHHTWPFVPMQARCKQVQVKCKTGASLAS